MSLTENQKKAKKMGIIHKEDAMDEQIQDLITLEEKKITQEKEEQEIKKRDIVLAEEQKKKRKLVLKNIRGEDVREEDYFYGAEVENPITKKKEMVYAPSYFNRVCGLPVDREDMIEVFQKVFGAAALEFLFYKSTNKEVYIIIVPLRRATVVGVAEDSLPGDFQKHAISFIGDGSVNLETLKLRLRKISGFIKKSE